MAQYILALDQGTTSSRAILFDHEQNILSIRQHELTQQYPREGWVEQDPIEIWSTQYAAMLEVLAASGVSPHDVAGIGITNQRETTILWERETGRPILFTTQSYGNAAVRLISSMGWSSKVLPTTSGRRPA